MQGALEGKLAPVFVAFVLLLVSIFMVISVRLHTAQAYDSLYKSHVAQAPFVVVLYMCVWKRPLLTRFVLRHYASLRKPLLESHAIELRIFIVGSDPVETALLASTYNADFAVAPNRPLGTKHNRGLQAIRDYYTSEPRANGDVVAIFGSDDIVNSNFFVTIKKRFVEDKMHIVGLKDVHFMELNSTRLIYTKGYRTARNPVGNTVGCGRAFSWDILNTLEWTLWDWDRDRSLDQSSVRRILRSIPQVAEISEAISGKENGIVAIDIKTDAFEKDANIWRFDQIVAGSKNKGPLHEFEELNSKDVMDNTFGKDFFQHKILDLRERMRRGDTEF